MGGREGNLGGDSFSQGEIGFSFLKTHNPSHFGKITTFHPNEQNKKVGIKTGTPSSHTSIKK
jgi:hypothetical protein